MKTPGLLRAAGLALSVLLAAGAVRAQACETIHFKRGHTSGTVRGVAPPDGVVCYEMATGAGQRASVQVKGRNVMFSIDGAAGADAQDRYSFATERRTYKIEVGQLMRSVTNEPFTLTVSVR